MSHGSQKVIFHLKWWISERYNTWSWWCYVNSNLIQILIFQNVSIAGRCGGYCGSCYPENFKLSLAEQWYFALKNLVNRNHCCDILWIITIFFFFSLFLSCPYFKLLYRINKCVWTWTWSSISLPDFTLSFDLSLCIWSCS